MVLVMLLHDSIIISTQGAQHQYKIPKSHVEGYNGAEVFLDISFSDIHSFNTDTIDIIKAESHGKEEGITHSTAEASRSPVPIATNQAAIIQGQQLESKEEETNKPLREEGNAAEEVSKSYIAKTKKESKQESVKTPIATSTTTTIGYSEIQNYSNNKPENTQQEAITTPTNTAKLSSSQPINVLKEEQGLSEKQQPISTVKEAEEQPVKSEVVVIPSESAVAEKEMSSLEDKPTVKTQGKNNIPPPPASSSLTTKTSEPPEKMEAEEVEVEKAVTNVETDVMTDSINTQEQQKIDEESSSPNTHKDEIIQPEVEVKIKPPNIEFNPPISAEKLSTAMEQGISGAGAVDDIAEPKGKEHQDKFHEEKIDKGNKHASNSLAPFTIGIDLWQQSIEYWIDICNEFAMNAQK
jgi:hypothetical protein